MTAGVPDTIAPSGSARTPLITFVALNEPGAGLAPARYGASVAACEASNFTIVPSGSDV